MKTFYHQLAFIFGVVLLATLLLIPYFARFHVLDDLLNHYSNSKPSVINNHTSPRSQWDHTRKYLTYLPFEGISNQFFSLQNAATIAKRLNRTLVVPPITSNRHDHLATNQPWSNYMDLEHMAVHAGVDYVEWHTIKFIDHASHAIIETGSRRNKPKAWKARAEPFPCQVIRNYGQDYFLGEEDSIGADFAYQFLLDLKPIPVPGYSLQDDEPVTYVGDIVERNQNSTDPVICLTFTFTAQFAPGKNRWDISWEEVGKHIHFLPQFASLVEDLVAFRFGLLKSHVPHPSSPTNIGTSILNIDERAETPFSSKLPYKDYIAIHLRRGDIGVKCVNQTISDCVVPLSEYKEHVDLILDGLLKDGVSKQKLPNVVLVSDTQSEVEKAEIDGYGWYRLDHTNDPNLLKASEVLGPFSPALIDSAVLTGRGARWVIGSRRSTMSWLAAMRLSSWYNTTIIYPKQSKQQTAQAATMESMVILSFKQKARQQRWQTNDSAYGSIVTWDEDEWLYFEQVAL
ncbi:hypothetical protein BX616_001426 [Lobosporangium transversale]|uniref:GDP-fucose protein O-fucosyltransferase-domain-containing protein n=1 Tax=Lobosporangium transversale TaxID=64571 RepID=A0A1Y2G6E5_9FUNG|nr:hypothetical protein BCR41DRAFT_390579 [Lobosporangium transversale]KAF9917300.1 hypothetical protein BX616_001426 [Lobosporangium transversale]ORY98274.1 hypothetical protein BCR41DRAFT_390579 [Lobosporangium transversale]|eukprot:XP_021875703.1 hypothetical protein BCR41DRAFT_390579 [Lobosporangium transversale]